MIPNFALRARARTAIKPVMQVLIVIALVATLPSLLCETVTLVTNASPVAAMEAELLNYMALAEKSAGMSAEELYPALLNVSNEIAAALQTYLTSREALIFIGMTLMNIILTPALMQGLYHALIRAHRKQEVAFLMAWPGFRRFFKGIAISWLTYLILFVLMLPGAIIGSVCMVFLPETLGSLGYTAGLVLALFLSIRAVFSYAMAPFIIADKPETGIIAALRRSRQAMKGRRMLLFSLEVSFLLWLMGLRLLQSFAQGMFGVVIGLTLGMFANLFLQVYMSGSVAAFYEAYVIRDIKPGQVDPLGGQESEPLTDEEDHE